MLIALALAAALTAALADPPSTAEPDQSPQEKIDTLQQVYDESCGSRGYGEYDDVCNSIRDQIRQAQRELRKQASRPKPPAPSHPDAAAAAPADGTQDAKPQAPTPQ